MHRRLIEVINREDSCSFLKKKMDDFELVWQQCRKIDKFLLEILSEESNEEAERMSITSMK